MTSIFGIEFLSSYGASKGGIMQLTRSLAVAWARDNIQVNCILPGFIDPGISAEPRRNVPGFEEAVLARTAANRWGEPFDLAGTAVFLRAPRPILLQGLRYRLTAAMRSWMRGITGTGNGLVSEIYPGSRKPRPLAVDECGNLWPGCRPTWALVRCHGLCPWGSTL